MEVAAPVEGPVAGQREEGEAAACALQAQAPRAPARAPTQAM